MCLHALSFHHAHVALEIGLGLKGFGFSVNSTGFQTGRGSANIGQRHDECVTPGFWHRHTVTPLRASFIKRRAKC